MRKITKQQLINLIKEEVSEIQSAAHRDAEEVAISTLVDSGLTREQATEIYSRIQNPVEANTKSNEDIPQRRPTLSKLGDERNLEESDDFDDLRRSPSPEEKRSVEAILDKWSAGVGLNKTEREMLIRYLEMTSPESTSHGALEDIVASMPPVEDIVASKLPVDPLGDTAEQPSLERPEGTYKEFPPLERPEPPGKNKDTMGGRLFPGKTRGMNKEGLSEAIRREIRNFLKSRA